MVILFGNVIKNERRVVRRKTRMRMKMRMRMRMTGRQVWWVGW